MIDFRVNRAQAFSLFLLLESFTLFLFSPNYYSFNFNLFCFIQYLISALWFLYEKRKVNYFDFDVFFLFTCFFVMFFYPVFVYENDPTRFIAFRYEFNDNCISKSTALALLGIQSYIFGSFLIRDSKVTQQVLVKREIPVFFVNAISVICFFLFVFFGGYQRLKETYNGEQGGGAVGIANYCFLLTPILLYVSLLIVFCNSRLNKNNYFNLKNVENGTLVIVFSLIFILLYAGSRTLPLQFMLIIGGLYSILYHSISIRGIIPLLFLGVLSMFIVVLIRSGGTAVDFRNLSDLFMDLIVNNRNSFVAVDYVEQHGITWGKSMLSSFLAAIPFLQNLIFSLFDINPLEASSSLMISRISLGTDDLKLGFGTNVVADLYLGFGALGVVLFMGLLGYFISYLLSKSKESIYSLMAYIVMLSYSVFIVRAEYFFFVRTLLWSLIILNIVKLHNIKLVFNANKKS